MITNQIETITTTKEQSMETPKVHMGQSLFDILFPKSLRIQAGLSDSEANTLYNLWKGSPAGSASLMVQAGMESSYLNGLKTKGYLTGSGASLELTEKGKKVIVEMVTHEPNAFEKHAKEVSYSGIKAKSANARPRQALLKKMASTEPVKEPKVFNLRKASLRRMSGQ